MAVVMLDLGHTGRTGGRKGAEFDVLRESEIVREYVTFSARVLERAGVTVEILGHGSYGSRQRYAARAGASAYVSCHVNAGWKPGYRGAVFSRAAALGGRRLAVCLGEEIKALTGSHRLWQTSQEDWTRNADSLIAQTGRVPAVVYEPVYIDNPAHRDLCDHPKQIGAALAAGLLAFLGI